MPDTYTVYIGDDNSFQIVLKEDGVAVALDSITSAKLQVGLVSVASTNLDTDPIRWAKAGYATGEMRFFLGAVANLVARAAPYSCRLQTVDPTNPLEVTWGDVKILVRAQDTTVSYAGPVATPPAIEPVTLAEAKEHLRVDSDQTEEDDLISGLIAAAREHVENLCGPLISQTIEQRMSEWPSDGTIRLSKPRVQSVTSIKYLDEAGTEYTVTSTDYTLDASEEHRPKVILKYDKSWPTATLFNVNPIRILYIAGYGDNGSYVPFAIKAAMKLIIGHLYQNRIPVYIGTGIVAELPLAVDALLANYRTWGF